MALDTYGQSFLTELDNLNNFTQFSIKGMDELVNIHKDHINLRVNENNEIQDMYILKQIESDESTQYQHLQYSTARLLKLENNNYSFFGSMYDANKYLLYTLKIPDILDIGRLTQIQGNNNPVNPYVNTSGITKGENGLDAVNFAIVNNTSSTQPATVSSITDSRNHRTFTLTIPDTPQGKRGKSYLLGDGNKYQLVDTATTSLSNFHNQNLNVFCSMRYNNFNFHFNKLWDYDFKGKTHIKFVLEYDINVANHANNDALVSNNKTYGVRLLLNNQFQIQQPPLPDNYTYEMIKRNLLPSVYTDTNNVFYDGYYKWTMIFEFNIDDTNRQPQDLGFYFILYLLGQEENLTSMFDGMLTANIYTY